MSKWYEVKVAVTKVIAVEIEDDQTKEDALKYALGEVLQADTAQSEGQVLGADAIEQLKMRANTVLAL